MDIYFIRNFQCGSDDSYVILSYTLVYCNEQGTDSGFTNSKMYHVAMIEYSDGESATLNIAADCDTINSLYVEDDALPFDMTDCSSEWIGVKSASTFTKDTNTNLLSECRPTATYSVMPLNIVEIEYSFSTKRIGAGESFTVHFRTEMPGNFGWFVRLFK